MSQPDDRCIKIEQKPKEMKPQKTDLHILTDMVSH